MSLLLSMPELVVNEILKNSDFQAVQTLRKVCHELRNFIDDNKPDAKISNIRFHVGDAHIKIDYILDGVTYVVTYRSHESGCAIQCGATMRILNELNHVDRFLKDFAIILSFQASSLSVLSFHRNGCTRNIYSNALGMWSSLNSRKTLLKTERLVMDVFDHNDVLSILPYLDSNVLEDIRVWDALPNATRLEFQQIEVREIVKLEQWRKAKSIVIRSLRFPCRLEYFKHCSNATVGVVELPVEQLEEVKKAFFHSSALNYFQLSFLNHGNELAGLRSLGHPYVTDGKKIWYFRIENSSEMLEIVKNRRDIRQMIFEKFLFCSKNKQ